MGYLGEYQAVSAAVEADKLDGKDSTYFEVAGTSAAAFTAHNNAADPHAQYTTALTTHTNAADPHAQYTTASEAMLAAPVQTVAGKTGTVLLDKSDVGLNNVTNDSQVKRSEMGVAGGVATLNSTTGFVETYQLPSYVDDVLEYSALASFPATGEAGKVYLDTTTNKTYRWSGSVYGVIGSDLAIGETSSTAYRGDRGKTAYDHSQTAHAPSNAEANVNADWNASSGDALILNKPTIPSITGLLNETSHDALDHAGLPGILSIGTTGTTACAGNDTRLSDARNPLAHTTGSHSDWPAAVSMIEVGYLDGVTSTIQTQLNAKGIGDVTTTGVQTLTNKTIEAASLTNGYTEEVYNLTGTEINPTNGSIQYKTLTGNTTFTEALSDGQSVTLMLNPATYTTTWPTATWIGSVASTAPTLIASVYNCITFFQFAGTLYGKYEGRV